MTVRTALDHNPAELAFYGCDDRAGSVAFTAASSHDANRTNTVALDTTNGHILCDCKGAECGRQCWHTDHVVAAWLASDAMLQVRWLTDAQLFRYGVLSVCYGE